MPKVIVLAVIDEPEIKGSFRKWLNKTREYYQDLLEVENVMLKVIPDT